MNTRPQKPFRFGQRARSFRYAWQGVVHAFRVTHNFRIHLGMACAVIALMLWLDIPIHHQAVLLLCIGGVMAAETLNTAVEELVDLLHPQRDPRAGRIKDLAAGAVLITALFAALAGAVLLLPPLWARLFNPA
jgi:diacylglycerol kinase